MGLSTNSHLFKLMLGIGKDTMAADTGSNLQGYLSAIVGLEDALPEID